MVKSLVSIFCAIAILIAGFIYESNFVSRQFTELNQVLLTLYDKVDEKTAIEDDVYAVQNSWLDKKKYLHVFIPHNEIKEIDLWLAESVKLVRDKKWEDAISKIEVLIELSEQIPCTFVLSFENVL